MLEQTLYQAGRQSKQILYHPKSLECLSASVLYTGPIVGGLGGPIYSSIDSYGYGQFDEKHIDSAPVPDFKPISLERQTNLNEYIQPLDKLNIFGTGGSFKIFSNAVKEPLTRLDLDEHEYGDIHLQHGKNEYFGRKGNEAADMLGQIYQLNPKLKFNWEKE